ncbi:hypothetical protein CROQUDRAFT_717381 [Cronartium quercuum f. sp. fusiforme G11]|uniref:Uncharacterized protein n=1 Tax=Cronartium quercuum f. sp. fusiforme G11 TaxID=708437 RepID=A0A9P6NG40_9BASI|nr:hypothetical protein CROQUDRAFT_717381 [Cronartium quercuum f. sp. fusiforme G11]
MKYSLLALFAPLFLIGLPTTYAEPYTIPVDLSPRITPNLTLFVHGEIYFNKNSSIRDSNKTIYYTAQPSTKGNRSVLIFRSVKDGHDNRTLVLFQPQKINCIDDPTGPYYLDHHTHEWILANARHKPGVFEHYYTHQNQSAPQGVIQADVNFTTPVATISYDPNHSHTLRHGRYAINFPPDTGHLPFIEPIDAITLVYKLIQAKQLCEAKEKD